MGIVKARAGSVAFGLALYLTGWQPAYSVDTTGQVFVYRYKRVIGSAIHPSVYCDDNQLTRLASNRYLVTIVSPGKHLFRSNDNQSGIMVDVKSGQDYYIRMDLVSGVLKAHGQVLLVPNEQGTYEVKKLEPVNPRLFHCGDNVAGRTPDTKGSNPTQISIPMSNADIIALKNADLADDLIIMKIQQSETNFLFGTDDLIALKKAKVSDTVISAMMNSSKRK